MVYGGSAFLLYFVLKWIGEENVKLMTNFLNQWKPEALVLGGFLLSGLVLVISYGMSRRIMGAGRVLNRIEWREDFTEVVRSSFFTRSNELKSELTQDFGCAKCRWRLFGPERSET